MPLTDFIRSPEGDRIVINTDHIVSIEPHSSRADRTTITVLGGRRIDVQAIDRRGNGYQDRRRLERGQASLLGLAVLDQIADRVAASIA